MKNRNYSVQTVKIYTSKLKAVLEFADPGERISGFFKVDKIFVKQAYGDQVILTTGVEIELPLLNLSFQKYKILSINFLSGSYMAAD
jgi:hypothetical protein